MKKILFLACLFSSLTAMAEIPLYRPVGTYHYDQEVLLTKKRTAETVVHGTAEGKKRMSELRNSGFFCVRKNLELSICQKNETDLPTPDFLQKAVDDFLGAGTLSFPGTGEIALVHDGADTEWMVKEDIFLGNKKVSNYKIIKTASGPWYLSFPVSEDQGVGNMAVFSNERLGLPLTLQGNNGKQTVGYFVTAIFIK